MKNINRYKLVPVLIIGLVLSALNATAEVKTVMGNGNITIKEGEVAACVLLTMDQKGTFDTARIIIEKDGKSVTFKHTNALNILKIYPNFKIAGPAKIEFSGGMLSMEITPNEKH